MKAADGVPFQFWTGGPSTALRDPWRKQMINIDASHHVTFATRIAGAILGGFYWDADPSTALRDPWRKRLI